jgi:hypothetical protein
MPGPAVPSSFRRIAIGSGVQRRDVYSSTSRDGTAARSWKDPERKRRHVRTGKIRWGRFRDFFFSLSNRIGTTACEVTFSEFFLPDRKKGPL